MSVDDHGRGSVQVDWRTPTWMSGYLAFEVRIAGRQRTFAVAHTLLAMEPDEAATATLQRNIFRLRATLIARVGSGTERGIILIDRL